MYLKKWIGSSLLLGVLSGVSSAAQVYRIEPGWSHVEFSVKNFGLNTVEGRFKSFSGSLSYDEVDATRSSVSVTIPIASVDTGNPKRDAHLQTVDFFEAARYPAMTFMSQRIEKQATGYVMIGSLTIKGHTRNVSLPFTFNVEKSAQGTTTLHAEAKGVINRHAFGIDYGSNFSVSKDVQIIIHIQAVP